MTWTNLFYNLHKNETCVIIGNGPSLNKVNTELLRRYPTFGTNRVYLLKSHTADYYASVNPLVIEQSADEINAYPARAKFIAEPQAHLIENCYPLISSGMRVFSYNPAAYIYEGHTVTFVCLQLAFHMGFSRALLVGVDHKFKTDGPPNSETVWQGDDPNHFSPEYFKNTRWNNPDLPRSEEAYQLAKRAYENVGREIINLTEGSALTVFKTGKVKDWLR